MEGWNIKHLTQRAAVIVRLLHDAKKKRKKERKKERGKKEKEKKSGGARQRI